MKEGMHGESGACMARGVSMARVCGGGNMCAGETATEAIGTHPTGMRSCLQRNVCYHFGKTFDANIFNFVLFLKNTKLSFEGFYFENVTNSRNSTRFILHDYEYDNMQPIR